MKRNGFTLIEMLVVLGILAILMGASIAGYSRVTRAAERAKEQELVSNVATALAVIYQKEGSWPKRLATTGASDGQLDSRAALALVKAGVMGLNNTGSGDNQKLIGFDRFGVVTPWATAVLKRTGNSATLSTTVGNTTKTIQDHILHYALDLDGDGIIRGANVGGASVNVRASAIVWSCGKDGVVSPYKNGKLSKSCDDVYSWQAGQTKEIQ